MKKSPIRRVSKKRAKELSQYFKLRKKFLRGIPKCQVCKEEDSIFIHHTNGREKARLNDQKHWLAICNFCHDFIHKNPEAAMKAGWLLKRTDNL